MNEQLVIRLASRADQAIHWLVWSNSENEIMASGTLQGAAELEQLSELASKRSVKVLVPSGDVHLRKVEVENKMKRQLKQALPYMLEDELASDVELLHFAQIHDEAGAVFVAIVEQDKMALWLQWLELASIKTRQLLPDVLALPYYDEAWTALQLDEQWLIRTGFATGISAEGDWLSLAIEPLQPEEPVQVHSFSNIHPDYAQQWQQEEVELPMQVLAQGASSSRFNLLQGEYQPKREYSAALLQWRKVAIVAALLLISVLAHKAFMLSDINERQQQVKAEIKQVHQVIFPEIKKIRFTRIKKTMKQHLKSAGAGPSASSFLAMLAGLKPAFQETPDFKPSNLKYDQKRKEMRLLASANSFQEFEQFKAKAESTFQVEQGPLDNKNGQVSGTLIIRAK